jgi:hypothetical protein
MPVKTVLKARGLYTFQNPLDAIPEGAQSSASNVVINRDGVLESRRGFKLYGDAMSTSAVRSKQLLNYKNKIIRHYGTTMQYDDGTGTFATFTGGTGITEQSSGLRIKSQEVNGNLYFTSSDGLKKISYDAVSGFAGSPVTNAGGVKALDGYALLNSTGDFLAQNSTVGYRIVWGIKDASNNLILGSPSERIIITNPLEDLLVKDFDGLLSALDTETLSGGINDGTYLSTLKLNVGASAASIKIQLLRLCSKLDTDTTITEAGGVATASISVTSNVATLTFGASVATFLEPGDYIQISGLSLDANYQDMNGIHKIITVVGAAVTFAINHTGFGVGAGDVGGTVKRLKYTTAPFREVATATPITTRTVTAEVNTNLAYVEFASDISAQISIGDSITVAGFTGAFAPLNGSRVVSGIQRKTITSSLCIVQFPINNSNIGSAGATDGIFTIDQSELDLTLSINPTAAQLENLQGFYDDIVTSLSNELAGIATAAKYASLGSTQSSTVNLTFTMPSGITTAYFYQIYRTVVSTATDQTLLSDLDPGDEMGLIEESNPTSGQILAKSVTFHDIVPDSFRGANLYTNPNSGEGIAQANEPPPFAIDIALFKNYTFLANVFSKYNKSISLLSVSGLTTATSTITISNGVAANETYTFVSPVAEKTTITCIASGTIPPGSYFTLNSAEDVTQYYVWYKVNGAGSSPAISGKTGIEVDVGAADADTVVATKTRAELNKLTDFVISGGTNQVIIDNISKGIATNAANGPGGLSTGFTIPATPTINGAGEDAANKKILLSELSTPAQQVDETARSLVRVLNKESLIINAYYLSGPSDIPGKMVFESRSLTSPKFSVIANSAATGSQFSPDLTTSQASDNEVSQNRIFYSKLQQPEAYPLLNYIDIGPKDKKILRILALRDGLVIFKEEGIYRISGESPPFVVTPFDFSTNLKAPDSAVVLNNQIYIFSNQGVATISDTGVSIISRPIENQLLKLLNFSSSTNNSFGVSYESDRSYLLWTVKLSTDTKPTQCFRYNTFTSSWTTYDKTNTCGIVNFGDDKLYLGAGDTNYIEVERKDFAREDYADREYSFTLSEGNISNAQVKLGTLVNIRIGDVLYQEQSITIYKLDQLLLMLDSDLGVADTNYYSTLAGYSGMNIRNRLTALATKLDADTGLALNNYAAAIAGFGTTLANIRSAYNTLTAKLNVDTGATFSTYPTASANNVKFEAYITSLNTVDNSFTINAAMPLLVGAVTIYANIPCEVTWTKQHFENPHISKHVRESTIIFENTAFSEATVSFNTDIGQQFADVSFTMNGNGIFGSNNFGNGTFGGSGNEAPFRTLIPRANQRCRYITGRFEHAIAREQFSIYAISFVYELMSERAWR